MIMTYGHEPRIVNMLHLPTERLAALADETPTSEELAHLTACELCARERAAVQRLRAIAAAESARIGAPLTSWESLAPALRADGLIDDGRPAPARRRFGVWGRAFDRTALRAAAAVLLVAGGVSLGRVSAGESPLPIGSGTSSRVAAGEVPPQYGSAKEAREAQEYFGFMYQHATSSLAQFDTVGGSDTQQAMRLRWAALEQVREAIGEALYQAPYDPVINDYYLTTLAQQEATLRQINTALPMGMRMNSF
jgi:hypothetical protein